MGGFLVAVRSDIFLALRSRALAVLFLVPAAAAFLRIALGKLQSAGQEAQRALIGQASAAAGELTGYAAFVDGSATGLTICYLLLVALAAHSLSFERDQGVIRHVLIRRVSRRALVVARFCSLTAVGGLFTLVVFVASWCAASLFYEFAPVVEDGYEIIGVAEMRAEILVGLKLALVPLPAVVAFGIFVSTWARSAAAAVGVAFGATLGLDLFKGLLGTAAHYLYASYHPSLVDRSYLQDVAKIVRGFSDVFVEEERMRLNLLVPLPAAALFLAFALVIVSRRKM